MRSAAFEALCQHADEQGRRVELHAQAAKRGAHGALLVDGFPTVLRVTTKTGTVVAAVPWTGDDESTALELLEKVT